MQTLKDIAEAVITNLKESNLPSDAEGINTSLKKLRCNLSKRERWFVDKYILESFKAEKVDAHDKQWSEYDELMKAFGDPDKDKPGKPVKNILKAGIMGEDAMTDGQHRMLIALFTNELDWTADKAFRFSVKMIPQLKPRLSKRAAKETDIRELYKKINKSEASKLINILKSISKRISNK